MFALNAIPDSAIVYEGSITAPEFGKKVNLAVQNGVEPRIIILNPTLDLSLKNIKSREMEIGRGVKKEEVVAKYADLYENMHLLFKQLRDENPELRKNKYPIEFQIYIHLFLGYLDYNTFPLGFYKYNVVTYNQIGLHYAFFSYQ